MYFMVIFELVGSLLVVLCVCNVDCVKTAHIKKALHVFYSPCATGDPKIPVLYQVERIRDGRSFCVRLVKAIQHGQPILICQASFHKLQPSLLEHQFVMPSVPPPDALLTVEELILQYLRYSMARKHSCIDHRFIKSLVTSCVCLVFLSNPNVADNTKQGLNKILADEVPIEVKPVNPPDFYRRLPMEPKKLFWVRAKGHIGKMKKRIHLVN